MIRNAHVLAAAIVGLSGSACSADRVAGASVESVPAQPRATIRIVCVSSPIPASAPALLVVNDEVWGSTPALGDSIAARLGSRQIDTIEVLKGPAAFHRFGEQALHGVIIIRTRDAGATTSQPE